MVLKNIHRNIVILRILIVIGHDNLHEEDNAHNGKGCVSTS